MNNIEYIARANTIHNYKYNYSELNYLNCRTKLKIICNIHGLFYLRPDKHLRGRGCPECSRLKKTKSVELFISESSILHNHKYDYSKSNYINNRSAIEIICPRHGSFYQTPHSHLSGNGCWKCTNCVSNLENEWLDFLQIDQKYRQQTIKIKNKWYKVDALINNIIYEFYGDFWHGNPKVFNHEDINMSNKKSFGELYQHTLDRETILKNAGYEIISIWQKDWVSLKERNQ